MATAKTARSEGDQPGDLRFLRYQGLINSAPQAHEHRRSNKNMQLKHEHCQASSTHTQPAELATDAVPCTNQSLPEPIILDIRREITSQLDLGRQCLEGLQQVSGKKTLPSLLLWDEEGQHLYEEVVKNDTYYLFHVEQELLQARVKEIVRDISSAKVDVLVELGAGSMRKTILILSALDQLGIPLVYYALDVDRNALDASISSINARVQLKNVVLKGLWGTYDDGAKWLSSSVDHKTQRHAVLWLGSSIANFQLADAGAVLGAFARSETKHQLCGMLVAVDGCQDVSVLRQAYDTPDGATRSWMRYALEAARKCLGPEAWKFFDDDNWRLELRWEAENSRFENYFVATQPLKTSIGGVELTLERDEYVHVIGSGKWDVNRVQKLVLEQGLQVANRWQSLRIPYNIYWLQPTSRDDQ